MADNNIWIAASDGKIDEVVTFLAQGISVNAKDDHGYNPLQAAVSYGHTELVHLLIKHGADVNIADNDGDTPLHACDTVECAELLLANGANLLATNSSGQRANEVAGEDGRLEVENYLRLQAGLPPAEPRLDPDELLAQELAAAEMEFNEDEGIDGGWEDVDEDEGVDVQDNNN